MRDKTYDYSLSGEALWEWFVLNFQLLSDGYYLKVPTLISHLLGIGFKETTLSKDIGQVADYSLAIQQKGRKFESRIHIHVMPDGNIKAHLDKYNPEKGLLHKAMHGIFELEEVKIVGAVLAGISVGYLIDRSQVSRS